ncbi:MAG TPA: DUF899 family protein, partial [Dehalococcoidia bacterium]|nr:DUF899 family protein [Dehalococcoidia bacterium]
MALERESYVGETEEYRALRDELLRREIALSDQAEHVAKLRRQLPTNPVTADYVFHEGPSDLSDDSAAGISERRLADMLDDGTSTLLLQHVMYHPDDDEACPMCSMWADGFNAIAHHIRQRASFVLTAKAGVRKLRTWGRRRGWTNIRLLSSYGSSFQPDFGFEDVEGNQTPGL